MSTITSANSVLMLMIPRVFPVPQLIQGYSTDDAFATGTIKVSESMMGVDGKKSTGYIPSMVEMEITLQADSPSISFFESWQAGRKVLREDLQAAGTLSLPSVGKSYVMVNGSLEDYSPAPDGKKVLQPRKFKIVWESVDPAAI